MLQLLRNHEKIAGWLLVIAFMLSSSFGAARSSCCCTVLGLEQTRLDGSVPETKSSSTSRPACCLPTKNHDSEGPHGSLGFSSNCDCQLSSDLIRIEPFKAKLEFSDSLVSWSSSLNVNSDQPKLGSSSAEVVLGSQALCSLQCSWQE